MRWTAWNTAALIKTESKEVYEMPDYDDWMNIEKKEDKPKKQTDQDMFNVVMMLNKAFGGEVVYK